MLSSAKMTAIVSVPQGSVAASLPLTQLSVTSVVRIYEFHEAHRYQDYSSGVVGVV